MHSLSNILRHILFAIQSNFMYDVCTSWSEQWYKIAWSAHSLVTIKICWAEVAKTSVNQCIEATSTLQKVKYITPASTFDSSQDRVIFSLCNMRRAIARARLHTRLNFPRRANHRTRKKKYVRKKFNSLAARRCVSPISKVSGS